MDGDTIESSAPIFNQLVAFKNGSTTIEPSLATHWKISPDGLTYTFYLRQGVKFHTTNYFKPTRDFNADDVIFTFERMRNPKHPFNIAYPAEFPYFVAMGMGKNLKQVFKVDSHTVQFILKQPEAAFLQNMAMEFASIYSAEYANQLLHQVKAANINQKPIGTGPFILKSYMKGQQIRYVANKAYWDKSKEGGVKIDQLIVSTITETMISSRKMLAGECNLLAQRATPINEVKRFEQNTKFIVYKQPGFETALLAYNTKKSILNNSKVRQALDMAMDKVALVKVGKGFFAAANNLMPPGQWSYDPSIKNASYDPAKAKALLKAAGYPNGFSLKFFINLGRTPTNDQIAAMIQADWKKIGVNAKLITYDGGEFWERAEAGEHDVIFSSWQGDNGDPDNWLSNTLGCRSNTNHAKWCSKPFDDLLFKARYSTNQVERIKLYQVAQKIIRHEMPISPLYHKQSFIIYSKAVKFYRKYVIPTVGSDRYVGITID
jgi:peptide/nickel transport system substrate-binding protein/dipeptide transport system substrate-binding protein